MNLKAVFLNTYYDEDTPPLLPLRARVCVCVSVRNREGERDRKRASGRERERMLNLHGILNGIHGERLYPHCQGKWSQGTLHFSSIKEQC